MHKILARQINKFLGNQRLPPKLKELLDAVGRTYAGFEEGQKLAERSLELSSKELTEINNSIRKSEQRYKLIIESTNQLAYDRDVKTGKIEWMGAVEKITGFSRNEFHMDYDEWQKSVHPELRDR